MKTPQPISWNVVTKNFHAHEQLQRKLRQKITKLERHLVHFPGDAVHLQIILDKHPKKELFTAGLVLRVPSNVLRGEKSGASPITAFDAAVKVLLRELATLKAELRHEKEWKGKPRRLALHEAKPLRFAEAPQESGAGPQSLADVVSSMLEHNFPRLQRYVRRYLWHEVTTGNIPKGAIEARAVVDEVTRHILAAPEQKPQSLSYLIWFYTLVRHEIGRRRAALHSQAWEEVPLEQAQELKDDLPVAGEEEPELMPDFNERTIQRSTAEIQGFMADATAIPPDEAAVQQELLEEMQKIVTTWPQPERDVFELHFVEGFEPDEVGMILHLTPQEVQTHIAVIHRKVRQVLLEQAAV